MTEGYDIGAWFPRRLLPRSYEVLKCGRMEIVCLPSYRIFGKRKRGGKSRTIKVAFEFELDFELDFEMDFELDFELDI